MTILETFIKLRDDLKTWVTNNLNQKANISYVDEKFDSISEFDPTEIQEAIDANTAAIDTKVDKVDGKGLSTNDYTTADKDKLATVETNANFYEHPVHTSHTSGLYKVTVDGSGHVSGATLAEKEDIVALGIPAQDTTYEEEIEGLSGRLDDVEDSINTTNETLSGVSQDFENYKTTNNKAVSTNASGIEANKTAIEAIQGDYLKSTDKTQLQDDINKVSEKATANASAIEILNGEGNGSIKQSIDNAFNEFAANVTNDDVVNTYKELIDYASKHGPEFTELVGKVDTINTNVGEIEVDISNYKTAVSDQFTEVDTTINNHVTNTNNPHGVTKEQVGLANVDNTSDIEKPISNAMQEALDDKANLEHAHSDLYYDKEEIEGLVTVDDIDDICGSNVIIGGGGGDVNVLSYATKQWVQDGYQPKGNYLTSVPAGYATESYVNNKIAAIPTPDVSGQINTHNLATDAHNDIRLLVDGLTTRLNTLADCDDTTLDQMSEVVEYIKSNQSLIEGITTKKVNVADIIDNLTTNVSNKPLSAAQGVVLKGLIEELTSNLSNYQPKGDYLTAVPAGYATEEFVTAKIAEAELGGEEVDLSEYVTESEMQNYAQPKGDYLTSIPSEYITEKELENKGYLTEHQSLEGLATEEWVEEKFEDHSGYVAQSEAPSDTSLLWLDTDDDSFESSGGGTGGGGGATRWEDLGTNGYDNQMILAGVSPVYDESEDTFYIMEPFELVPGKEYTVYVKTDTMEATEEYLLVAEEMRIEGIRVGVAIGNTVAVGGTITSDAPFVIAALDPSFTGGQLGGMYISMDGATTAHIRNLIGPVAIVRPIPVKYLPGHLVVNFNVASDVSSATCNQSFEDIVMALNVNPNGVIGIATHEGYDTKNVMRPAAYSENDVIFVSELIAVTADTQFITIVLYSDNEISVTVNSI